MAENNKNLDKIVNLAKRRGFVFPGSEIYGGLANTWDYGPLGAELKKNIKDFWWRRFVHQRGDMVGIDSGILMNSKVWEASGHVANFNDPLIECKVCHQRFRSDKDEYKEHEHQDWTEPRQFNQMFKTFMGPVEEKADAVYLRPETAQGMFVNFKNILDTTRRKLPFGIAQVGKNFRNEITAGNFIFRDLEFDIAEFEYFVKPGEDEEVFEMWLEEQKAFLQDLGLQEENLKFYEHPKEKLSHYSKRTVDILYKFPFGWDEITGLANRTDYDLKRHAEMSGVDLQYHDQATGESFYPYVLEPTFGVDRILLAVLCEAYTEVPGGRGAAANIEESKTDEAEILLNLDYKLSPYQVAVLPLSKKVELSGPAQDLAEQLRNDFNVMYDETQSIGRRYRRQDEIGTPYCVTVDFDSLEDRAVTIRDRNTMQQDRVPMSEVNEVIKEKLSNV